MHREGSNVFNGRYYVDKNPKGTIVHYSSFRNIDVAGLRKQYEAARNTPPADVIRTSPLKLGRRQSAAREVLHARPQR